MPQKKKKIKIGYLLPFSLGEIMRKSTLNLLRCIDKMAICMYNLSDYVLVTITAGQDVAEGEAEVERCYVQDCISAFLCTEANQCLCYLTVTLFMPPGVFKQWLCKQRLPCLRAGHHGSKIRKYIGFIRYRTDTTHSKFTGI